MRRVRAPNLLAGVGALVLVAGIPAVVGAQSAKGLLDKMLELESKRAEGVSDYAMDVTTMGHETTLYYERVSMRGPNGKPMRTFRLVSFAEMQSRQQAGQGMSPEAWQAYSDALRQTGAALSGEMDKGMNEAGLPPAMRDAMGSGAEAEPWASPNPSTMMSSMADFADAAGKASAEVKADTREHEMEQSMALFRKRAKIVGKESVGKLRAIHARADNLNIVEKSDGEELEIHSISLWIDAANYVPLKMRMEGVAKQGRQSREVFIERFDQDYRPVPGSKLYMPYQNIVRMHGVLSLDQEKQMEDARKQLADLDKQLAEMPPEQRAQVEKMAGSQIAMLRKMVDRGEMEVVTEVRAIRVNTGLEGAFAPGGGAKPGASGASAASAERGDPLVQSIQHDLIALGYDPGEANGEMSTPTIVAISKFQAENGLDVTGDATPQLAGILAAKRDAAGSAGASPGANTQSLEEARAACLQEKIDAAKKKKRAFGRVMKAAANTASRYGGSNVASEVEKASQEAYKVDATAKDVEEAADALGLSKADVEACRNPG
ncbi:MAG: peptidoglycan-binding domain-containing protein [Myxococcales bacterium]|jgi:peptidoglycan hydrolase-like protein with peptidoglycan-binding domain